MTQHRRRRKPLPSLDVIREYFAIDPASGSIIHQKRPLSSFSSERICNSWNSRFAGKPAGYLDYRGYVVVCIAGEHFFAHRVIWKYVTGEEPDELDHINRNPADNRLENLRAASRSENNRNRSLSKYNTTGFAGVYKGRSKWVAQIKIDGKARHLGQFETIDEAIAARRGADALLAHMQT